MYVQQKRKPKKILSGSGSGVKKIEATTMRIKVLLRGGQGWPMIQIEARRSRSSRAQGRLASG